MKIAPATTLNNNNNTDASSSINATSDVSRKQPESTSFGDIGLSHPDDLVVVSTRKELRDIDINSSDIYGDNHIVDIKSFLSRPFPVASGVFAVTDDPTTFSNLDLGTMLKNNDALTQKIQGLYLTRFDIKLQLVINADKFQQGRYILAGVPIAGMIINQDRFIIMHRHSKAQITQLPHIQMDLANDSHGELLLPWPGISTGFLTSEWNHNSPITSPWAVFLYPYSALVSPAGSVTASYTLFLSLENVTLGFPAVPQMGTQRVSKRKMNPMDAERSATGTGFFEKSFSLVKTVSDQLTEIPLLSSIATPVSWVADAAAKVCAFFGWSKPTNLKQPELIKNLPFGQMTNCDGIDNAQPLSLFSNNSVGICPGFARTDQDEMSIDFIKSIPAYLGTFTWTLNDAVNHEIFKLAIDPTTLSTITTEVESLINYIPINWLLTFFQYWRGSITFNVKVVKTSFHSGRILAVFSPYFAAGNVTTTTSTMANSNYCYREVIDLKEKFEFQITIPYVHCHPWKNKNRGATGWLSFIVLDPLVAPATVSNTVTLLVEVCGGPDFEVAVPVTDQTQIPMVPYTVQMATGGDINSKSNPAIATSSIIGGSSISSSPIWNAENCIGETVKSLRLLVKRFSYVHVNEAATGKLVIRPFAYEIANNVSAISHQYPVGRVDMLTHISMPYLLSRGSVRIKTISHATPLKARSFLSFIEGNLQNNIVVASSAAAVDRRATSNTTNLTEHNEALTGSCDVQVPQYHGTYARHVGIETVAHTFTTNTTGLELASPITLTQECDGNQATGIHTYRAAGDDYNLGYFISIPPYAEYVQPE